MKIQPFEELIEIDSNTVLLLEKREHPNLGLVIEIRQMHRTASGKVKEGGIITLPANWLALGAIDKVREFCEGKITPRTPQEKWGQWVGKGFQEAQHPIDPTPLPVQQAKFPTGAKVNPERLQESVPNTTFSLEDLVYAMQHNKPFSNQIKVPLPQVKVLLYYGMMNKSQMITMDVEKELLKLNIIYDFKRTGLLLKELHQEGLIQMEERQSKSTGRRYYLWKFPTLNSEAGNNNTQVNKI